MARQVLPIVGLVVGAYFGAPQLGYAIGSLVGNAVDPEVIRGPKIGEAGVQTSAEGIFRPVVKGTGAVKGNIIERGNRRIIEVEEQEGKGGPVVVTERVLWTFGIRIAEGPIASVLRIWQDEKLVYDNRAESLIPEESLSFRSEFNLYLGDEDQLPDPDLEAYKGVGNVNAYRGTAYIVFPDFDLTDYGERIPDFRFEVAAETFGTPLISIENAPNPIEAAGGVSSSIPFLQIQSFDVDGVSGVVDGALPWQPLFLATLSITDTTEDGFIRAQLVNAVDDVLFDTGWIGRGSDTNRLAELLNLNGRPDLIGPREGENSISREIRFVDPQMQISGGYLYAATPEVGGGIAGSSFVVDFPRPELLPDGTNATNTYGVLRFPDGTLRATEWGPENVYEDGVPTKLQSIVAWAHNRANQPTSDYSVALLDEDVNGVVFAGDYTCADVVRTLQPIYMFDYYEADIGTGYRGHYMPRGGPVALTLVATDLVDEPEKATREDALERPRVLHMHFESPIVGYVPAKATSRRNSPDVKVVGEQSISVPVSFLEVDEAWRRCEVMHKVIWTEIAGEREFVLGDKNIEVTPTDVVALFLRGQAQRLRVTEVMLEEGILKIKALADRQSAYTSTLTGVPLPPPTPPPPSLAGQTIWEFLDIPALTDGNDSLLYYLAATGQTPAWNGALAQRMTPVSSDWENVLRFTRATIMGQLVTPLAAASPYYTDTTNSITVSLFNNKTLQSLTQQQFLSEGGSFALQQADGVWEILQYRDAEQDTNGDWILSPLLRGRLNTPTGEKLGGSRFVLLDGVRSVSAFTSLIGQNITHRLISFGTSPESANPETDTWTANSQREFPVANIIASRDADTLSIRLVPRHRFGTEDNPVRSINWLSYDWEVTDGSSFRSGGSVAESFTVDVTGMSDPLTVTAYQRNRYTGLGPGVTEIIE